MEAGQAMRERYECLSTATVAAYNAAQDEGVKHRVFMVPAKENRGLVYEVRGWNDGLPDGQYSIADTQWPA